MRREQTVAKYPLFRVTELHETAAVVAVRWLFTRMSSCSGANRGD